VPHDGRSRLLTANASFKNFTDERQAMAYLATVQKLNADIAIFDFTVDETTSYANFRPQSGTVPHTFHAPADLAGRIKPSQMKSAVHYGLNSCRTRPVAYGKRYL